MRFGVALVAICAVLAAPASAGAPTLLSLQRQVTALNARVALLQRELAQTDAVVQSLTKTVGHNADATTCGDAEQADNLNSTWHTLVLLAVHDGFQGQPDYPRFDDGGACARLGITRSR